MRSRAPILAVLVALGCGDSGGTETEGGTDASSSTSGSSSGAVVDAGETTGVTTAADSGTTGADGAGLPCVENLNCPETDVCLDGECVDAWAGHGYNLFIDRFADVRVDMCEIGSEPREIRWELQLDGETSPPGGDWRACDSAMIGWGEPGGYLVPDENVETEIWFYSRPAGSSDDSDVTKHGKVCVSSYGCWGASKSVLRAGKYLTKTSTDNDVELHFEPVSG